MKTDVRFLIKSALSAGLLLFAAVVLTACNTVDGMGDDLKSASEETSEAIDDATD